MTSETATKQQLLEPAVLRNLLIYVEHPEISTIDEFKALFGDWPELFKAGDEVFMWIEDHMRLEYSDVLAIAPKTRRQFALLPAILRKAEKMHCKISCRRNHEYVVLRSIYLDENPSIFWQALALAQMWYEKPA